MTERMVEVKIPYGLHLRPASKLADVVLCFKVKGIIYHKDSEINIGSVLNMVATGIRNGEVVKIQCKGNTEEQEKAALDCIESILSNPNTRIWNIVYF